MFNIDRRLLKNFDIIIFATVLIISLIGVMTIYSATRPIGDEAHSVFYIKQATWLALGIFVMLLSVTFDYIWLGRLSSILYIFGVILLVIVFIAGRIGLGAQRWLSIGPLSFQPSEFFKLFYIIFLTFKFSEIRGQLNAVLLLKLFFTTTFFPFILLIEQPDLGTALIIIALFLLIAIAKGIQRKIAILLIIISLISMPFLGNIFWGGLKEYQKSRLIAFLYPESTHSTIGYQINQSKITVGSGESFGKGYIHGTQGPFRFLPEKHTDFIFAIFAEEWGFAGSFLLLFLYFVFLMRGMETALKAREDFGKLLALGITLMFLIYFTINVGMTLGLMPVVGIPLPFMSYGGTALLSNLIAVGILINIKSRRFELFH
ncbi:MAG: rod shape-determining protein RodA [Nitrospirae bacterium]|jgi:rod shape determining protein RodA|nr:rod shape-determining protein RodA [Nitrospirota bacterium]